MLTQERLSELVDVAAQYLFSVERGAVGLSVSVLKHLCAVLLVPGDFILMGDEDCSDVTSITARLSTIARLQQYIYKVRPQIQDEDSTRPTTHHGPRNSSAARMYQESIDSGMSPLSASLRVSQLLGHERPDVTRGYLASVKDDADGK